MEADQSRIKIHLVSGTWGGQQGPINSLTDITVMTMDLQAAGKCRMHIPAQRTIFFYVVRGIINVNARRVEQRHLVEFNYDGDDLNIEAVTDSLILLCHATPFGEPMVAHGPFVMNTREEIHQAIVDYQAGKFNG